MITFSAFADEIAPGLAAQMDFLRSENIHCIDVRAIDNVNVSKFTKAQADEYAKEVSDGGFTIPCIGSPIGKIRIDEPFEPHLDLLKHCCELAHVFGAPYVRVFSFYGPEGGNIADHRSEVMDRLQAMAAAAEQADVVLLHENERGIYGALPDGVRDIFETAGGEHFKGIFDPANFVFDDLAPYDDCWTKGLAELTHYFHIKDARREDGTCVCVPSGQGQGQIAEVLADAKARGFDGYMAIEPHLSRGGKFGGFTGPDLFAKAIQGIRGVCDSVGLAY